MLSPSLLLCLDNRKITTYVVVAEETIGNQRKMSSSFIQSAICSFAFPSIIIRTFTRWFYPIQFTQNVSLLLYYYRFFLLVVYYLLADILLCELYCWYEMLSSFSLRIRKYLFPNNGEVTSLIHCSSDKLSAIPEARRPPPFLSRQPFASAFPLVLFPFTIYTRMARANLLISRYLIWRSIKIFAGVG